VRHVGVADRLPGDQLAGISFTISESHSTRFRRRRAPPNVSDRRQRGYRFEIVDVVRELLEVPPDAKQLVARPVDRDAFFDLDRLRRPPSRRR
jgi:hypothetical protein